MDIILYLINIIQYQHQQICWLLNFICKYIPLKQWAFDDSHSPEYQKFKVDKLPVIQTFYKQDYKFLIDVFKWHYGKTSSLFLYAKTPNETFPPILSALAVAHHTSTFTTTMGGMDSSNALSAPKPSKLVNWLPLLWSLNVLIVVED